MGEVPHFLLSFALLIAFSWGLFSTGRSVAWRLLPFAPWPTRMLGAALIVCWLAALLFAILLSTRLFSPLPATLIAIVAARLARKLDRRPRQPLPMWGMPPRWAGDEQGLLARLALPFLFLLAGVLFVLCLVPPPLGWDSLTYHTTKASLWAQNMGWRTFDAPGGWEYYKTFLGGGEMFTAWAMMFFRGDFMAGVVDWAFWLLQGLVIHAIAVDSGVRKSSAFLLAAAACSSVEVARFVSSGYIDTCGTALLFTALHFSLRFRERARPVDLVLALAAAGLAASVKFNLLFAAAIAVLPAALRVLRRGGFAPGTIAIACIVFLVPPVPWLIHNAVLTGYPLGCLPASVGGLVLGKAPPNLEWFLALPADGAYEPMAELMGTFYILLDHGLLLVLAFFSFYLWPLAPGRERDRAIFLLLLAATLVALYFSSSFTVIRRNWPVVNGRFLFPAVVLLLLAAWPAFQRWRKVAFAADFLALASVITGTGSYLHRFILTGNPIESLILVAGCLPLFLWLYPPFRRLLACRSAHPGARGAVAAGVLLFLLGLYHANRTLKFACYETFTTLHAFPRDWVPALPALDNTKGKKTIAVTFPAQQISHHTFVAPFFGPDLENTILHVPSDRHGRMIPHHPFDLAFAEPSFPEWHAALKAAGVTHVLSLPPRTEELEWMLQRRRDFIPMAGDGEKWGLFRLP
jgi:hypothetical protein